jgi:hypothetical protein
VPLERRGSALGLLGAVWGLAAKKRAQKCGTTAFRRRCLGAVIPNRID